MIRSILLQDKDTLFILQKKGFSDQIRYKIDEYRTEPR